jgi:predicted transcriptional regulator
MQLIIIGYYRNIYLKSIDDKIAFLSPRSPSSEKNVINLTNIIDCSTNVLYYTSVNDLTKGGGLVLIDKIKEFKPHKLGLSKVLGDLETEIMEIMWRDEQAMVRDVHKELVKRREIAYTTVMTVMGRLVEKKILAREQVGNAYVYSPRISKNDFCKLVVREVIDGLLDEFAEPAISHFISRLSQVEDETQLKRLEDLIAGSRKVENE